MSESGEPQPIEVEPSRGESITHDPRPPMPEPPPVRLISVADVHLPAAVGRETELNAFYVDVLQFLRQRGVGEELAFAAENFWLYFDLIEPPLERDSINPTNIEVPSLPSLRQKLNELEIEYEWVKSLLPGEYTISLQDPAGNWLAISERHVLS